MDTANDTSAQPTVRLQRAIAFVRHILCSPRLTGGLLAVLDVVLLLRAVIPQQASVQLSQEVWLATLPVWFQPWAGSIYQLGLSRIGDTPWLWASVALLMCHSLIALADYWPLCWRRAQPANKLDALAWQHPLASRAELSVRLPASPDEFLANLKQALQLQGFTLDPAFADDDRAVSAGRWRWSWLTIVAFYGGLGLLCGAFLLGHYFADAERLTLYPFESRASRLVGTHLELTEVDAAGGAGAVALGVGAEQSPAQKVGWRLYWPTITNGVLVWPVAAEPLAIIEIRDERGELRRLIPVREDLSPNSRLSVSLNDQADPFIFSVPTASLAFQISLVPAADQPNFNVQVRRGTESVPSENRMIVWGEPFEVDNLVLTLSRSYSLELVARHDWSVLLAFGLAIALLAASVALLFWRPPWQVWLMPEVKGRGGQLYGVVEKLGLRQDARQFLEHLFEQHHASLENAIKN